MKFTPDSTKKIERLLIVRLSAMGDVIHTLPAAQLLREAFPAAHVGWLIEERWAELLSAPGTERRGLRNVGRPIVDEVHAVQLKAWGKSFFSIPTIERIATVWNDIRDVHYDVAIDLQGAIRSAVLARCSGASIVLGAAEPRESPASLLYNRKVVAQGRHVVEQNLSVARALAARREKTSTLELPHDLQSEHKISERLAKAAVHDFAILNPGAGWGAKRWPAHRYGEVAQRLALLGLRSMINYGPGEEDLAKEAEAAAGGAALSMKCNISELIAITRRARLFVGGDTGPLHLAAALQVPVVGIYGPTDPGRNGPYGTKCIVLRSTESLTTYTRNAAADGGMMEITADEVAAAAAKLLTKLGCQEAVDRRGSA